MVIRLMVISLTAFYPYRGFRWIAAWEEEGEVGYLGMIQLFLPVWLPAGGGGTVRWLLRVTELSVQTQAQQIQCSLGICYLPAVLFHGVPAHISAQETTLKWESGYSLSLSPNKRVIPPGSLCSLLYLALDLSLKHPQFQLLRKTGENRSPWLCLKTETVRCSLSW